MNNPLLAQSDGTDDNPKKPFNPGTQTSKQIVQISIMSA